LNGTERELEIKRIMGIIEGQMTPGAQMDLEMDAQIQKLDEQFRVINFGQPVTHEIIEGQKPQDLNKESQLTMYRKWKHK